MFSELKTLALIGGAVATLTSCTVANRIDADRDKWRVRTHAAEKSAKSWEASYHYVVKLRTQEAKDAQDALTASRQDCNAEVADERRKQAARRALHLKPVKFDAKNCPIREIWKSADLGLDQ